MSKTGIEFAVKECELFDISLEWEFTKDPVDIDFSCVSVDRFFNFKSAVDNSMLTSKCITLSGENTYGETRTSATFKLSKLPSDVKCRILVLTCCEKGDFSSMKKLSFIASDPRSKTSFHNYTIETFSSAPALVLCCMFQKDSVWHVRMLNSFAPEGRSYKNEKLFLEMGKGVEFLISNRLQCELAYNPKKVLKKAYELKKGQTVRLGDAGSFFVGMSWKPKDVEVESACLVASNTGGVLKNDTIYFAEIMNSNSSLVHQGSDSNLGDNDLIRVVLDKLPSMYGSLFFIFSMFAPLEDLSKIKEASVRVLDETKKVEIAKFKLVPVAKSRETMETIGCIYKDVKDKQWRFMPTQFESDGREPGDLKIIQAIAKQVPQDSLTKQK